VSPAPSATYAEPLPNLTGAACDGHPEPDLWDTDTGKLDQHRRAIAICQECPARYACLADQLAREGRSRVENRWGIYGGKTPEQRARIAGSWRRG
jgi:WhiB family redox-sensing transcriptional regulator